MDTEYFGLHCRTHWIEEDNLRPVRQAVACLAISSGILHAQKGQSLAHHPDSSSSCPISLFFLPISASISIHRYPYLYLTKGTRSTRATNREALKVKSTVNRHCHPLPLILVKLVQQHHPTTCITTWYSPTTGRYGQAGDGAGQVPMIHVLVKSEYLEDKK